MAFGSYRDFVEQLDKAGELVRVTQPVATELEITELADREMKKPGGGKALLIREADRQWPGRLPFPSRSTRWAPANAWP